MDAGLFVQYAVITLAVLLSLAFVARRQFPASIRRMRTVCAIPLVREGRSRWLRRLGRRIAPAPRLANGCGGCNGCDP